MEIMVKAFLYNGVGFGSSKPTIDALQRLSPYRGNPDHAAAKLNNVRVF